MEARTIGADGNHLKLLVGNGRKTVEAIQFGFEREVKG
ncbi:hypothetical protein NNO_0055 [Hydrogenimonas sp.]|nr:hypothetical protein NNO_0055 [Hydrogenimonas sp.]